MNKRLLLQKNGTAGFTLLEMLVVVIMVGILAAIAAPNWLALMNRQRAATARDHLFQTLRTVQSDAKVRNIAKTITFDPTAVPPTIQYNNLTEPLGQGEIKPDVVGLEILVNGTPTVAPVSITFDSRGGIVESQANDLPITLTATVKNTTVKRCVAVETLIGNMRDGKDTECN